MNTVSALTTPKPGAATNLKEQICQLVVSESSRHFSDRLLTVILTGSMARDEATFQPRGSGFEVLGDAEFVLVFRQLPERAAMESFILDAQRMCVEEQIACKIDCSAVLPEYFQKLRPSIYSYELLTCGQVCGGDKQIPVAAPRFSANAIPREDAWRMLCNRLIELLEVLPWEGAYAPSHDVDYRAMKLNLDLATSILVFAGLYQPSYVNRARAFQENLQQLSQLVGVDIAQFAKELDEYTDAKLGRTPLPRFDHSELRISVKRALDICSWEMQQLLESGPNDSAELMRLWMGRQSMPARLRGWAYVAREQGWLSSWKQWPRWSRMALAASPRYWIYQAAVQVAQQFAAGNTNDNASYQYELPLKSRKLESQEALRREIARNYRECVVGTNA